MFLLLLLLFNAYMLNAQPVNGQQELRVCPPFSGAVAQFCNVNVQTQLCVNDELVVGGLGGGSLVFGTLAAAAPSGQIVPSFGNTIRVDQVYGDDSSGEINGLPFLTISAALAAADPGDFVWIFPGIYNESIAIPAGVTVVGIASNAVTIQQIGVTDTTDLVTMGENSQLQNVTLQLTSDADVQLRGIVFPGTTSATANVFFAQLTVDNSGATAPTSNIYGVHSNGTGLPTIEVSAVHSSSINVNTNGSGTARGILVDTANGFNVNDTDILVTGSGTNSIGVETNDPGAAFVATSSNISGTTADISQTLGSLTVGSTNLVNSNANNLGFSTNFIPGTILWADPTYPLILFGTPLYMRPGTSPSNISGDIFLPVSQQFLAKSLSVNAAYPPGGTETTTWTIRRNGNDTPVTVTLTGDQVQNVSGNVSAHFDQGDQLSIRIDLSANADTGDVIVILDTY